MLLLRWLWGGNGHDGEITPIAVFWTLRVLMFLISFVLEDWALHELIASPRHRSVAVVMVASSYVTWTYQTHTFSNSVETLVVAWSLVLIQRIVDTRVRDFQILFLVSTWAWLADHLTFGHSNGRRSCRQQCSELSQPLVFSIAPLFQHSC